MTRLAYMAASTARLVGASKRGHGPHLANALARLNSKSIIILALDSTVWEWPLDRLLLAQESHGNDEMPA